MQNVNTNLVYIYDGTLEGFLCCVYESYARHEIPRGIRTEGGQAEAPGSAPARAQATAGMPSAKASAHKAWGLFFCMNRAFLALLERASSYENGSSDRKRAAPLGGAALL